MDCAPSDRLTFTFVDAVKRLVVLSPFGVHPVRSGGHAAVFEPASQMALAGIDVHLFGFGLRRFEAGTHWRSFVREIEPRLVEERLISPFNVLDYLARGRSGLPSLRAGSHLARRASALLRQRCESADVVQYECPWLWPFRAGNRPRVLVNQNAEVALLERMGVGSEQQRARAANLERSAWAEADLVICLTDEDREELAQRYGARVAHVLPLGADVDALVPATEEQRTDAREALGVTEDFVILFTGAWHPPNRTALDAIRGWAADAPAGWRFVVAGSVGDRPERSHGLIVTAGVPDLGPWFHAADCCINAVTTGSGANVKILEYLARGLPVATTPFGARGIALEDGRHAWVRSIDRIPDALSEIEADRGAAATIAAAGRTLVCQTRSWRAIAERRRALMSEL